MSSNLKIRKALIVIAMASVLAGCQSTVPPEAMQLNPQSLQKRQLQSKKFDTLDEANMLTASMEVLQDMGFMIKETDSKLGVIVATKERETDNRGQRFALLTLKILAGDNDPMRGIEHSHKIRVSLVTNPDRSKQSTTVRVNFQRQVLDMKGELVKLETIDEQELYTGFFSKLSKSVFLEAHEAG
jgi:hypothetical protein